MARASRTGVRGLYREGNGHYSIDLRWRDSATGEWRRYRERLPFGVPGVAAKNRARELLAAALGGGFDPKRKAPRRLGEAFAEYGRWCEVNRAGQAVKRKATCARLLAALGDVRLDAVSPFHVERFKRDRAAGKAKPATVNRDLEVLSHFYGLAASWGWVPEAHARAVRGVPHLKEPPGRVRYLTADEEQKLIAALPARIRPIVVTALLSGMRQSEVVKLGKEAVDLAARTITLTRTKANRVRRVYVNDALAEVLAEAMRASPGSHVFANGRGRPYTADGVRAMFRRAVAKAELADFRFHDLRHTVGTRMRRSGIGIDVIAEVLGHSTLTMARRYAHLDAATLREAMGKLSAPASDPAPVAQPLPTAAHGRGGNESES